MITTPITQLAKSEWKIWFPLAIFSFVGASLLMSGWPQGLLPELHVPFTYSGDGIANLWNIQRTIEGAWYFANERAGFPFGSNHLDYPASDSGSYIFIKLLGFILKNPISIFNIYYLFGFSLCALTTYLVARAVGVSKIFSIVAAILYSFTSFHFGRIVHLFFTWYFVVPLFFYVGFRLLSKPLIFTGTTVAFKTKLLNSIGLLVLASFGIYYAFFGFIIVAICTLIAAILRRSWIRLIEGTIAFSLVAMGAFLNIFPSVIHVFLYGENRESVNRSAGESEHYAFKITQLFLPREDHRLDKFAEITQGYNNHFPLITENISASMGGVASFGLLLLLIVNVFFHSSSLIGADSRNKKHDGSAILRLQIFGGLAVGLLLIATTGGFSSIFSLFISSSIRSWNRMSIFIVFISVLALIFSIDILISKCVNKKYSVFVRGFVAAALLSYGMFDQTVKTCRTCNETIRAQIMNDTSFIKSIETKLPLAASVYQLPYMAYPEHPAVNGIQGSTDHARAIILSSHLRWSFGGMRGRTGDWFFRKLALLPIDQQITVIKAMGFAGVYVDRRGYLGAGTDEHCKPLAKSKTDRVKNNCLSIVELEQDIGDAVGATLAQQKMVSQDAQLSFTPLLPVASNASDATPPDTTLADSYLKPIGFKLQNRIPVQLEGGFEEPLDLRKSNLDFPHYVGNVTGLSGLTNVNGVIEGRWSDAHVNKHITVWLSKPLPKAFTLAVHAQASGLNAGKAMKIKVGKQVQEMVLGAAFSTQTVHFETNEPVYKIEFIPADPFSPARRWGTSDKRLLAVQIQTVTIRPKL